MATYNGEKYILEQLESFANQTTLPDELIITDDASTDKTLEIINIFKKTAPFEIKVYSNKENLNCTQNFNKALELCTNELIFLSDQDDVWFPNKIEYLVKLAKENKEKDIFMNDAELVDAELKSSGFTKQEQIKNAGFPETHLVMGCCSAVRKRFLTMILPIPKKFYGHDDWIVRLSDFLDLRIIDKTILQLYRRHGSNESQAVYNSLTKVVPKKNSIYIKMILWLNFSKKNFYREEINNKRLFIEGIERLTQHQAYTVKTDKLLNSMKNDLQLLEQRYDILLSKNIISQINQSISFYKTGKYSLKSLISDMIKK